MHLKKLGYDKNNCCKKLSSKSETHINVFKQDRCFKPWFLITVSQWTIKILFFRKCKYYEHFHFSFKHITMLWHFHVSVGKTTDLAGIKKTVTVNFQKKDKVPKSLLFQCILFESWVEGKGFTSYKVKSVVFRLIQNFRVD